MQRRPPVPEIAAVAQSLRSRLSELVERAARRIREEIDIYGPSGTVPEEELRASLWRNIDSLLAQFARGSEPDLTEPSETGRLRAIQGGPLPDVLRAYRLGFAEVWAVLADEAGRLAVDPSVLVPAASDAWQLADEYSDALTSAYRRAAAELVRTQERERSALTEALLTGRITDRGTLWEVAQTLGLPRKGPYVTVAAEATALGQEPLGDVEARLAAHGIPSAWALRPDLRIGIVCLLRPDALDLTMAVLRRLATARVGVSPAFASLDGSGQALRHARLAMNSRPAQAAPRVVPFQDDPLTLVMAAAPEAAADLARTVMGPVLALGTDARAVLLDTFQSWIEAAGNATATARALHCHPNTVRYRLRKLEDLTGRSLQAPGDTAELVAALRAVRFLPDPGTPAG
ncbi:helix-turn-helix domain-containing protein [Streptomyces actinomycinicus]|uniref:Helix-turn-helix domain-containing protein n=1 Tax=Streptomyces actinomycinicus TaxID=1695166 RepID=A0A937JS53_9ACTN|nr:helix-turn-helix domain-containing protein [Streptomyces actinomycinicus]MBL1085228.1 helix-turn-helix domain-containing protein [Streptomyces actinomycinicus]